MNDEEQAFEEGIERELAIQNLLELYGIPYTDETSSQMEVFLESARVYANRTGAYGQVWKQYGALSNLLSVARKVDRIMNSWWWKKDESVPALHKDNLDDAVDLLNYTAFFIRNAKAGNLLGTEPRRP